MRVLPHLNARGPFHVRNNIQNNNLWKKMLVNRVGKSFTLLSPVARQIEWERGRIFPLECVCLCETNIKYDGKVIRSSVGFVLYNFCPGLYESRFQCVSARPTRPSPCTSDKMCISGDSPSLRFLHSLAYLCSTSWNRCMFSNLIAISQLHKYNSTEWVAFAEWKRNG